MKLGKILDFWEGDITFPPIDADKARFLPPPRSSVFKMIDLSLSRGRLWVLIEEFPLFPLKGSREYNSIIIIPGLFYFI